MQNRGSLPFARFMELALYCPVYGYYEKEGDIIGRHGDYYTSVSTGSLFGELLAWRFAEWLTPGGSGGGRRLQVVEAGAHRGDLASDILNWMQQQRPALFERLEYWIVEPSLLRQKWQQNNLGRFRGKVSWVRDLSTLPRPSSGDTHAGALSFQIICSNELLDSFPVHRFGWSSQKQGWFEWGVAFERGRFVWTRLVPTVAMPDCPPELQSVLPDGFTIEVSPLAIEWWRRAAQVLSVGKLLTFDYGITLEERFAPERVEGTLRSFQRHQSSSDVLSSPGAQDITAHVDFSALQGIGEAAGLKTETLETQAKFLTKIAAKTWEGEARFGEWTPERKRQFSTLTHPEHLGRAFRVLVQSRD